MATPARRLAVAINPTASFGRGRATGPVVVRALRDAGHEVVELTAADADALERDVRTAIETGVDALVVVGGDGMVNLGVQVVAGTPLPLGLVPSGTGNDTARALGVPHDDPPAAIRRLLAALDREPRVVDAALTRTPGAPDRWFGNVLSAGFDAIVNERANAMRWPRGRHRYTRALLAELVRLRPRRYLLELDGERLERDAVLICAANGVSLGGGMRVTPAALLDDGLLDVMVVAPLSRLQFLRIFPRVFAGEHVTDPHVEIRRARRIRVDADDIVAYGDGERFGPLPVEIECVPGALRVLA